MPEASQAKSKNKLAASTPPVKIQAHIKRKMQSEVEERFNFVKKVKNTFTC